jgi:hypothetical protein
MMTAFVGMALFRQIEVPTDLPIVIAFRMDRRALATATMRLNASAVLFGLVPAIQATRPELVSALKETAALDSRRRARRWIPEPNLRPCSSSRRSPCPCSC